jgi:hypothetical protein
MRTTFKLLGIFCLATMFAICFTLPASAQADGAILDTCVKECSPDGKGLDFCKRYCACVSADLDKAGTFAKIKAAASQTELEKFAFTCIGREGPSNVRHNCLSTCPTGEDCKEGCACLEEKVKTQGSEFDIGKFITQVGTGEATASAKMKEFSEACFSKK